MVPLPEQYREEFRQETRKRAVGSLWVMSFIALILYPPTFIMDWISYPELFGELTRIRFGTTFLLAVFVIFQAKYRHREFFVRHSWVLVYAFAAIVGLSLDLMSLTVGGPDTPYYAGLNLLILGVLVAVPWGLGRMSLLLLFIIGQYDLAMVIFDDEIMPRLFFVANYFFIASSFVGLFWTFVGHELRTREFVARKDLEREKARSEELLLNVLPQEVADELKAHGKVKARHIDACSILFTDFVGFTKVADKVTPDNLVKALDKAFSQFDGIMTKYGLEKLKTIGDAYMCAAGVLQHQPDHLLRCILGGLEMLRVIEDEGLKSADGSLWRMRVGIHPGPVVAGVIGRKKFAYDLWGDTVNTASRLESSGQARSINLATPVFEQVREFFVGEDRGFVPVKGKGPMPMTRVTRLKPEYSSDAKGMVPNNGLMLAMENWTKDHGSAEGQVQRKVEITSVGEGVSKSDPLVVLAELSPEDRALLMDLAEPMAFRPGQVLIEQGQSLKMLLLIMKGVVGVRVSRSGISIEVGLLHPGEIVGELSFVSWEPAAATVVALDEVVVLRLDMEWMEQIMAQHPGTGVRLYHSLALILAQRVRTTNATLFEWREQRDRELERRSVGRHIAAWTVPASLEQGVEEFRRTMNKLADSPGASRDETRALAAVACSAVVDLAAREARTGANDGVHEPGLGAYVLRELFPFMMRSALVERIYAKPLERALDYIVLEHLSTRSAQGHGELGEAIDAWFLEWDIASALRGCIHSTMQVLAKDYRGAPAGEPYSAALMSGGAAPMLLDVLEKLGRPANVQTTCLDPDLSSLSNIGQRVARMGLDHQFTYVCKGALEGRTSREPIRLPPQNHISFPILTEARVEDDFLDLLDEFYDNLQPGGTLALGLPALSQQATFVAEVILEWHPARWTESDVRRFVARSAFADQKLEIQTPEEGGYFLAVLTRRESDETR